MRLARSAVSTLCLADSERASQRRMSRRSRRSRRRGRVKRTIRRRRDRNRRRGESRLHWLARPREAHHRQRLSKGRGKNNGRKGMLYFYFFFLLSSKRSGWEWVNDGVMGVYYGHRIHDEETLFIIAGFFFAFVSYHFSSFRGAAAQVTKRLGPGCLFFLFGKRGWSWGMDVRENSEVRWEMHYHGEGKAGRTTHSRSFFFFLSVAELIQIKRRRSDGGRKRAWWLV